MNRSMKKLVEREKSLTYGNHAVIVNGSKRYFQYFGNTICIVDDEKKTYALDHCGYEGSVTTRNYVHNYDVYFSGLGYTKVSEK